MIERGNIEMAAEALERLGVSMKRDMDRNRLILTSARGRAEVRIPLLDRSPKAMAEFIAALKTAAAPLITHPAFRRKIVVDVGAGPHRFSEPCL